MMTSIAQASKRLYLAMQSAGGHWLAIFLMAAMAVGLWDAPGTHDMNTWRGWARHTAEIGIVEGYAAHPNYYPPLTITILGLCQKTADALSLSPFHVIKLSLLICLAFAAGFIYLFSGRNILLTFFSYSALLLNSLGLAYLDLYFIVPLLLALYCLHRQWLSWFAFCFSLACLVKYQPLMMAPFLAIYLLASQYTTNTFRARLRQIFVQLALPALLPWILAVIIFPMGMLRSIASLLGEPVWLGAQGLNANWILTRYLLQSGIADPFPPGLPPELSMIRVNPTISVKWVNDIANLFYLMALAGVLLHKKTLENLLYFAVLGNLSWYMWHTDTHENHLTLTAILIILLYCLNPAYLRLMVLIVVMSTLNMFLFYGIDGQGPGFQPYSVRNDTGYDYRYDIYLWAAIAYVVIFCIIWLVGFYRIFQGVLNHLPKK